MFDLIAYMRGGLSSWKGLITCAVITIVCSFPTLIQIDNANEELDDIEYKESVMEAKRRSREKGVGEEKETEK